MSFSNEFIDRVAVTLKRLIAEAHPRKPYAALLYASPMGRIWRTMELS